MMSSVVQLQLGLICDSFTTLCLNVGEIEDVHSAVNTLSGLSRDDYYLKSQGKVVSNEAQMGHTIQVVPRLCGGKGGFGSMLRAIGAQIEKTTNREACRDLSGRRLRDINEEQRLKKWISQQGDRDKEVEEKKKKKLEKLSREPKHEFKDEAYEAERSELTAKISDSLEQGFKATTSSAGADSKKRKTEEQERSKKRKKRTLLDDSSSSEDESNESSEKPSTSTEIRPQINTLLTENPSTKSTSV